MTDEQRAERIHHHMYETCEGIHEHAERIVALEELVSDYDKCLDTALWLAGEAGYPVMPDQKLFDSLRPRMRKLGIEGTDEQGS